MVSILLDEELANFIGKKGSANGITFFNRKSGDDVIVVLFPTNPAEKPYGIAESILVSEQIILSTKNVDKDLGEAIVAASLSGKKVLFTDDNDVSKLLPQGTLSDSPVISRDKLLETILAFKADGASDTLRIDIDKAFPVNGVGTVVLGVVISGTVKVHDTLHHTSGKECSVRSIQSQDVSVQSAGPGTRVGLAMKGIDHDEMDKGDVLSTSPIRKVGKLTATVHSSPIAKESIHEGATYTLASNFSHSVVKVASISGESVTFDLEKPLPIAKGDGILLMRSQVPRVFASGTVSSV